MIYNPTINKTLIRMFWIKLELLHNGWKNFKYCSMTLFMIT